MTVAEDTERWLWRATTIRQGLWHVFRQVHGRDPVDDNEIIAWVQSKQ